LYDGAPAALQGAFKQTRQHVIKGAALEMVKPNLGHEGACGPRDE
jgi:hypothetical protein